MDRFVRYQAKENIQAGDAIVIDPQTGMARKATDEDRTPGKAVIRMKRLEREALEAFEKKRDKIIKELEEICIEAIENGFTTSEEMKKKYGYES